MDHKVRQVIWVAIYPKDMSTPSISKTCPAVIAESSMSFKASSLLQVIAKPSSAPSKLARGYKDFKILRVRPADYFMFARMIFLDLVGRLSNIWGHALQMRTHLGRKMLLHYPPSPLRC
jgi:hypothetical protein